jgi:DNA excision repair protein ERCC-2
LNDKRSKLPKWINQYLADATINLSTDMAIGIAKKFLRTMAQPFEQGQLGVSLWSVQDVLAKTRDSTTISSSNIDKSKALADKSAITH